MNNFYLFLLFIYFVWVLQTGMLNRKRRREKFKEFLWGVDNYQNYIEYEKIGETIYMCPESYEKRIDEISALREKRPNVLLSDMGYSKINDFNTRVNNIYKEPLPSPANFDELFY